MFDDPTRGVDVGSRTEIGEYIVELAKSGAAVILVSSDLNELVGLGAQDGCHAARPSCDRTGAAGL